MDISVAQALERAEAEATAIGHTYTGTEHILLALLAEERGGAAHIFALHGVDLSLARQIILKEMQRPTQ